MLQYVERDMTDRYSDEPWMFSAEDQCWDEATLKQLRDEHGVIFMTDGDGVIPVMVNQGNIVLGMEDDGTIQFPRHYGQFDFCFSPYWVKNLIADLQEAYKLSRYEEIQKELGKDGPYTFEEYLQHDDKTNL